MGEIGGLGRALALLLPGLCVVVAACAGRGGRGEPPAAEPGPAAEPAAPTEPAPVEPAPVEPAPADPAAPGVERRVGAAAQGSRVELGPGELLVVELESNPSTGYGWRVSRCDESVLRLDGEPTFVQGGSPGLVGAGGVQTLRLRPVAPGETDLELSYVRPWETGVPPARTFSLRVAVR